MKNNLTVNKIEDSEGFIAWIKEYPEVIVHSKDEKDLMDQLYDSLSLTLVLKHATNVN